MPNASALVSSLTQRGVKLWTENGQLHIQSPKGSLLPEELNGLRAGKREIIELLERSLPGADIPIEARAADSLAPLTAFQLLSLNAILKQKSRLSARACVTVSRVRGRLDHGVLRQSLDFLVRRHESLRTRIVSVNGTARQCVDDADEADFEVVDVSGTSAESSEARAQQLAVEFVGEKVDVYDGKLFRVRLLRLSTREHVLILALHHLISDGMSNEIVCREIWSLYGQIARGAPPDLPPLAVQFPDYAVWQHETRMAWLTKHDAYWKERLEGAPPVRLPFNHDPPDAEGSSGAILEIPFGDTLSHALKVLARRERTLLPLIILTVYVAVMSRWCNQRDLVVPCLEHGRHRPELADMVGFLSQVMPLRIEWSVRDSFRDLLGRISSEFYAACEHQEFHRVSFVEELGKYLMTDLHFNWMPGSPVEQSVTSPENVPEISIHTLPQLFPIRGAIPAAKFRPYFFDTEAGLSAAVVYCPEVVEPGTIELFGRHIRMVAVEFARDALCRVESVLAEEELSFRKESVNTASASTPG